MRIDGKFIQGTALSFALAYRRARAALPAPARMFRASDLSEWATDEKICGLDQADRFADRVLQAGKGAGFWNFSRRLYRWVVS